MTKQITSLTEVTTTEDGDLLLVRDATDGVDKKMQAQNLRAKATTKDDVGLGNVDNVSAADLRDRSTHTGTQTLSTISDAGTIASQDANSVDIDGGTIDGTAVNATDLAYSGTLTGGTGIVNLGSGQVYKDASGNVGLNDTSPNTSSSYLDFSLGGFASGSILTLGAGAGSNSIGKLEAATTNEFRMSTLNSGGFLTFRTDTGGAGTEAMRINSSGNVGIGTTSPSAKLHVVGASGTNNLMARFAASISNQTVEVARTGTSLSYISLDAIANISYLTGGPQLGFRIANNDGGSPNEAMRIDSSGNVLIGTTSSASGESNVGIYAFGSNGRLGVTTNQSYAWFSRTVSDGEIIRFTRGTTSAVGSISVTTSATSYNTSSDYRLKQNIQPLTGALDKVQAMNPVTYDWKAGGEGEGFIAHELQEIAPYAVSGEKDGEDMQGVDYGKLTTLLVSAVKELTAKVEQLEAQLGANNGN